MKMKIVVHEQRLLTLNSFLSDHEGVTTLNQVLRSARVKLNGNGKGGVCGGRNESGPLVRDHTIPYFND